MADDVDKKPAVLAINVATGKPIAPPARSRRNEPLGNLIFVDGDLISQSALTVSEFPELKRMLAKIDLGLKQNPTDPVALTDRGELYLDKGELKNAVEDFRTALANKPPADVVKKAKEKLYESLTDLLQSDFPAAEKYLDQYRDLCHVEVPANADPNTKLRLADNQLRREASYLSLLGRGREHQGRLLDAFAAYEKFGGSPATRNSSAWLTNRIPRAGRMSGVAAGSRACSIAPTQINGSSLRMPSKRNGWRSATVGTSMRSAGSFRFSGRTSRSAAKRSCG